jgi:hypothetical protein
MTLESDGFVIPVMNDDQLWRFLNKIKPNENDTLPWVTRNQDDQALRTRIESLGVSLIEGDSCWVWQGATGGSGYPQAWVGELKRAVEAYRVSYAAYKGLPLPDGSSVEIHHACKNILCVRPGGNHAGPLTPDAHASLEGWLKQAVSNPDFAAIRTPDGFSSLEISFPDDETT